MRGDRVGVGDIGAVQGGTWVSGDETYCVNHSRAVGEHERGMVGGPWLGQHFSSGEQCRDWIGASDSSRGWPWACYFHDDGAVRTDGMRGDRVGVGDIGAMPCGARRTGDSACGADGRGAVMERDGGMLIGLRLCKPYISREFRWYRVGINDGTRIEPWSRCFHGDGAIRADGLQGDRVGVRDIDAMPYGTRCSWVKECFDDDM